MSINNIYITNFSVFNDLKIEFCKGINVIIGENGTGKTHLLKFMYALHETTHEKYLRNGTDIVNKENQEIIREHAVIDFINNCFRPFMMNRLLRVECPQSLPNITSLDDDFVLNHDLFTKLGNIVLTFQDNYHSELSTKRTEEAYIFGLKQNGSHQKNSVFVPAKEMLSHAPIYNMSEVYGNEMPFDNTQLKIIELSRRMKLKETPDIAKSITEKLELLMKGTIREHNGSFWKRTFKGHEIPFTNESDGLKRFGLLWRLLMNGSITKDTILFWDEPENSINPENIPVLVEILLELQRHGVQMFLTTHNYNFARYFEILKTTEDKILFNSLDKTDDDFVKNFQATKYSELGVNAIDKADETLYKKSIQKAISESKNG